MKHKPDPFVKRSTLRYLTRGETPSVRAVALQLHFGMVTALREGDGAIHATWKEVADWAGVSYASVKRAVLRLRELGWVKEQPGHRIVFDYRRSCPAEKAQIELAHSNELETFQEGCTYPSCEVSHELPELPPSGEDGRVIHDTKLGKLAFYSSGKGVGQQSELAAHNRLVQGSSPFGTVDLGIMRPSLQPSRLPRMTTDQREALAALVAIPGVDRAGAVKAVKTAGGSDLVERVRLIVAAVQAMPVKPWKPGGLIVAAVSRPELGRKLIHDHATTHRKPSGVPPVKRNNAGAVRVPPAPMSHWDAMRQAVRSWLDVVDLSCAEDLAWIVRTAAERGWNREDLRSLPELRNCQL